VTLDMQLVGGNAHATPTGQDALPGLTNYLSSDPALNHTGIVSYGQVQYQQVYNGINAVYHTNPSSGQLEYDFVVAPHADPGQLKLAFRGADQVSLDADGNLLLHTAGGNVVQQAPVAYQTINGTRQTVASQCTLDAGGGVGFRVGAYNPNCALTIDPSWVYSSYLGGTAYDKAEAVAFSGNSLTGGTAGTVFVVGETSSPSFRPSDPGQQQITPRELPQPGTFTQAAFAIALDPANSNSPVYFTYLEGNGANYATSVAVDAASTIYITGFTNSTTGFPPSTNAWQPNYGGDLWDAYVTALKSDGQTLAYSTYLGGPGADQAYGIALDGNGNAYVGGSTASGSFGNPPNTHRPDAQFGPTLGTDGFVAKLNGQGALTSLIWIGGSGTDTIYGIATGQGNSVFVSGSTMSNDLLTGTNPTNPPFHNALTGTQNAFAAQLNYTPGVVPTLVYDTYFGDNGITLGRQIAVVPGTGDAYVAGSTTSQVGAPNGWGSGTIIQPTVLGALGAVGSFDAWVAKFDVTGKPTKADNVTPLYFVYIAGKRDDYAGPIRLFRE
jgi:hypothetical protein